MLTCVYLSPPLFLCLYLYLSTYPFRERDLLEELADMIAIDLHSCGAGWLSLEPVGQAGKSETWPRVDIAVLR